MDNVNWLSMIIATFLPLLVGSVWYHKSVFGSVWMDAVGMTEEKARSSNMFLTIILSLFLSFVLSFFLLNFNNESGQEGYHDTFLHGAWHGAFVGIIIITPVFVINALFEQKSWRVILINVAYWILTLALMGGVLDAMNHWES